MARSNVLCLLLGHNNRVNVGSSVDLHIECARCGYVPSWFIYMRDNRKDRPTSE